MRIVILFGGGDGGGIIIDDKGVHPIPPFGPDILYQLRAVNLLLRASAEMGRKVPRELATLTNKATNLAVERVESAIGPLEGEYSLVFDDVDGGFVCGSTGKPPIPFPSGPHRFVSASQLVSQGLIQQDLVDFIAEATSKGTKVPELLEDPAAAAKNLGRTLSEESVNQLRQLAPSTRSKISDPVDLEIVNLFDRVAEDGRYLSTWASRPYEVAKELGVQVSEHAIDRLLASNSSVLRNPGEVMNPVAIAVVVGVVIMLVDRDLGRFGQAVIDRSGVEKF